MATKSKEGAEILQLLHSRPSTAKEIAERLHVPPARLRGHLAALLSGGLIESYEVEDGKRFRLDGHAATLLNASVANLLNHSDDDPPFSAPAAGPVQVETEDLQTLTVPVPPDTCLTCQNTAFVRGVLEDLDRVLTEARQYQSRAQQLSSQILGAHEAERKRIARELHDDTAQSLTSILVRLRLLERSVQDEAIRRNVEELRELTGNALDSVRRMALDLRPPALDDLGLAPALRSYSEKFSRNWPTEVTFSADGLRRRLPPTVELVLYRVVQEALSNIAKHSGASRAAVSLARKDNVVTARVQDNGRGFDEGEVVNSGPGGLGLFGMKERLALVGGSLEIESAPNEGTVITAWVPLYRSRRRD